MESNSHLKLTAESDLSYVWTFQEFEKTHGPLKEVRRVRFSNKNPFLLCFFENKHSLTPASVYSKLGDVSYEDIKAMSDRLYVGHLKSHRYVIFDDSWKDWETVCLDPDPVPKEPFEEVDEWAMRREETKMWEELEREREEKEKLLLEIKESWSLESFMRKHLLIYIGHDYYPVLYCGCKVYTYLNRSNDSVVRVFNYLDISIDQILVHRDVFKVVLTKGGYYEFRGDTTNIETCYDICEYLYEWHNYDEEYEKYENIKEEEERKEYLERLESKRRKEILYDFSGDDSSLDPRFW